MRRVIIVSIWIIFLCLIFVSLDVVSLNKSEENDSKEFVLPNELFDIKLELDDNFIQTSDELSARVIYESFGTVPTHVDLDFIIRDENGNKVYHEEGKIVVRTEEVSRKSFYGLNLPKGKYIMVLQTLYNVDVFDEYVVNFEVGGSQSEGSSWKIIFTVISVLALGVLLFWLFRPKRKHK